MKLTLAAIGLTLLLWSPVSARAEDPRQLVPMPEAVQQDLVQAMLEHMSTLDTILSMIATERFEQAAKTAEQRLRIGPFDPAMEQNTATYFPPAMQDARAALGEAGTRLATAARKADADHSYFRMKRLAIAVGDVTATCNMCHARYRIR